MSVLQGVDVAKTGAEDALAFLAEDKSVQKFDTILRADQVTKGTSYPTANYWTRKSFLSSLDYASL